MPLTRRLNKNETDPLKTQEMRCLSGDCPLEILLVEDSPSTRMILEKHLLNWGFSVTSCADGHHAIDLVANRVFDLVITDWVMPNMDGIELIKGLRAMENEGFLYIIVLTALSKREDLLLAFTVGADDYLTKPVDYSELRARIRTASRIADLERRLVVKHEQLVITMERMKKDLEAGAELQLSLLPATSLERNAANIDFSFQSCTELAGDVFNYFPVEGNKVIVYLLDVSGHGVKAALLAVTLSRLLNPEGSASVIHSPFSYTGSSSLASPEEVVAVLNRDFQIEKNNSQFFTMIYGILDTEERTFTYVCAGHPPMIYINNLGEAFVIEGKDVPIGFVEDYDYEKMEIKLNDADRLFLYSDGIPEAVDESGQQFGIDRMVALLKKNARTNLRVCMQALVDEVNRWCGEKGSQDDISVVGIEMVDDDPFILDLR